MRITKLGRVSARLSGCINCFTFKVNIVKKMSAKKDNPRDENRENDYKEGILMEEISVTHDV